MCVCVDVLVSLCPCVTHSRVCVLGVGLCTRASEQARNESACEILRAAGVGNKDLDASQEFHHCFFFGDLNYRVNIGRQPIGGHIEVR